jgi:hypothetical protein
VQIDAAGGSHRCNAFKEGEVPTVLKSQEEMDASRYLHFYERWNVCIIYRVSYRIAFTRNRP